MGHRTRAVTANRIGTFIANRKTGQAMRLLNTVFYAAMVLFAVVAVWRVCRGSGFFMDTAEHIHSSWLVSIGKVPYRDFFEHHNPLFWYVLAPFVAAFYKNALVLYAARVVSLGFYIFMFAGFYKLCREFLAVSKTVFGLALLLYFLV